VSLKIKQQERQKYEFYNGQITLEYDPVDHVYLRDGAEVPSVTTVLKIIDKSAPLMNWAVKLATDKILQSVVFPITNPEEFTALVLKAKGLHRERLEDAGDIGKLAHDYIEKYIIQQMSPSADTPPEIEGDKVWNCFRAALEWMRLHNVHWVSTERKIYSRTYDFAGTLDGIAFVDSCNDRECCPTEFKSRRSLIDWKSSNALRIDYLFQTAAYQYAIEEESGDTIEDRWVIRLGKSDGKFEAWHLESGYEEDFRAFLNCLDLTRSVKSVTLRMTEYRDRIKSKTKKRGQNGKNKSEESN